MKRFYLLLCAMFVAIASNAADYYLIGGFNGWAPKDANSHFTDQGDGTYVLDYNGTLTSGFKINDGTWSNDNANFGGSAKLVLGETYNLTVGGASGNIPMDGNVENPHIVFNPTAKTLVITGQETEAAYVYGIHGDIFGVSSWSTEDMTEKDGVWTLSATVQKGNFGIKVMDASTKSQTDWISSAGAAAVVLDTPIACKVEGTNFTIGAGEYTFAFDPEAMTLTVTGKSEGGEDPDPVVDYSTWYVNVLGDFNSWTDNGVNPNAEGVSIHENLAIGTSAFKIKIWDGTADLYYVSDGNAIVAGEWTQLYEDTMNGAGVTIAGATESSVYNVEYNCATNQIKVTLVGGDDPIIPSDPFTVYFYNTVGWEIPHIYYWGGDEENTFPGTAMEVSLARNANDIYSYTVPAGTTGVIFTNGIAAGEEGAEQTGDFVALANHLYTNEGDQGEYTGEVPVTGVPETLFILGNLTENSTTWNLADAKPLTKDGYTFSISKVQIYAADEEGNGFFTFASTVGSDWDTVNSADRFGASENDTPITLDTAVPFTVYQAGINASSAASWKIPAGNYDFIVNFANKTVLVQNSGSGVVDVEAATDVPAVYYNLQGVQVETPAAGLYIEVRGNVVRKVVIK